jgi:hypothetical protein
LDRRTQLRTIPHALLEQVMLSEYSNPGYALALLESGSERRG